MKKLFFTLLTFSVLSSLGVQAQENSLKIHGKYIKPEASWKTSPATLTLSIDDASKTAVIHIGQTEFECVLGFDRGVLQPQYSHSYGDGKRLEVYQIPQTEDCGHPFGHSQYLRVLRNSDNTVNSARVTTRATSGRNNYTYFESQKEEAE